MLRIARRLSLSVSDLPLEERLGVDGHLLIPVHLHALDDVSMAWYTVVLIHARSCWSKSRLRMDLNEPGCAKSPFRISWTTVIHRGSQADSG